MSRPPPPEACAQCGADIPRNARACPECGADERTGWREASLYDGLDLPDGYDDEHQGQPATRGPRRTLAWYWWLVAFVLLLLLVAGAVTFG